MENSFRKIFYGGKKEGRRDLVLIDTDRNKNYREIKKEVL